MDKVWRHHLEKIRPLQMLNFYPKLEKGKKKKKKASVENSYRKW